MKKALVLGTAIFTLGSLVGVGMTFAAQMSFSDVKSSDWFYSDVQKMVEWDVIRGNPDGTFRPGNNVNRAELSAMWNRYNSYVAKNYYSRAEIDALIKGGVSSNLNTNTAPAIEASKTIALNSTGTLNGVSLTVKSLADHTDSIFQPKAGNKFVVVDVLIKNDSGATISINPLNFTLSDSQSYVYERGTTTVSPALGLNDLENGREVRGFLGFEVPQSATLKEMKYEIDYGQRGQFYVSL